MRKIEPNRPAFMRACCPTITFSSALIVAKSRMFWNVLATPRAMMRSGRRPVMSRPSNSTRPKVGL